MKKNPKGLWFLLLAVIVIAGIIIMYPFIKDIWNKPLGESISLPTLTETYQINSDALASETGTNQSTPSGATTTGPLCGGPSTMFIEALGVNDETSGGNIVGDHLADVIRIVRVDFVTPSVAVLDIPRDTWVEYPPLADPRIQFSKINQATQFGINAPWRNYILNGTEVPLYDGPGGGPGLMARVLDLNFGIRVDNYGMVGFDAFIKIVDAVGGIDVYLPEAVDGTAHPGDSSVPELGYFPAGENHLDGQQALNFARIRKCAGCTTTTRTSNQNLVLCALQEKVLTPSVLPSVPSIISSLISSIETDLSPAQISQLTCLLPHLSKGNIIFTEPPAGQFTSDTVFDSYRGVTTSIFKWDQSFKDTMQEFIAGTWPVPSQESSGSFCP